MDRCHIRIVEQKNVIGMDTAVIFEAFDNVLNGETSARDMLAHGIACRQNIAVG